MDDIMEKYKGKVQFVLKNAPRGNLDDTNTKYVAQVFSNT